MSARERVLRMCLTDRSSLAVWAQADAVGVLDAYRAEVLREAVALVELHVDLGAPPERILTELRRMADTNTTQET